MDREGLRRRKKWEEIGVFLLLGCDFRFLKVHLCRLTCKGCFYGN